MASHNTAVVIGAASGIGAALAERYRSAGSTVLTWDVRRPCDVACDITSADAVDAATTASIDRIGVPDEVTVTAGIGHGGLLLDLDVDELDRVLAVNTRGPLLAMRAFARAMVDAGRPGSIVAVSSVSAHLVDRNLGAYCASKSALNTLVKVAAAEWAVHGIRVNAVGPGVTDTPILGGAPRGSGWLAGVVHRTALGRLGTADEIAEAVTALHGLGWVTGQVLDVDGGLGLHSPINSYGEGQRAQPSRPG